LEIETGDGRQVHLEKRLLWRLDLLRNEFRNLYNGQTRSPTKRSKTLAPAIFSPISKFLGLVTDPAA
jgi:hypothetical protein